MAEISRKKAPWKISLRKRASWQKSPEKYTLLCFYLIESAYSAGECFSNYPL